MPFQTAPLIDHLENNAQPLPVDLYARVGREIFRVSQAIEQESASLQERKKLPPGVLNLFQALPKPFFPGGPPTSYFEISYRDGAPSFFSECFQNDGLRTNFIVLLNLLSVIVTDGERLHKKLDQAMLDDLSDRILAH